MNYILEVCVDSVESANEEFLNSEAEFDGDFSEMFDEEQ